LAALAELQARVLHIAHHLEQDDIAFRQPCPTPTEKPKVVEKPQTSASSAQGQRIKELEQALMQAQQTAAETQRAAEEARQQSDRLRSELQKAEEDVRQAKRGLRRRRSGNTSSMTSGSRCGTLPRSGMIRWLSCLDSFRKHKGGQRRLRR